MIEQRMAYQVEAAMLFLKSYYYKLLGYKIVNYPLGPGFKIRKEDILKDKLYSKVDGWRVKTIRLPDTGDK